jgi:hypothetical protein
MDSDPLENVPAKPAGDDFEMFFWGLVRRKYPQQALVYLPAQMGGDYGLEGFSTDGIAYQCYADQDSLSLRARTDKQKKKLYEDTVKLKTYASKIEAVLGGLVISHYFLCVPQYHAAELVKYAEERAKAVRNFGLNWIAEDFAVRIKTPEDYPAEMRAALFDGAAKSILPPAEVVGEEIEAFADNSPYLASTLVSKLGQLKAHHPTADVEALREQFIKSFLDKEQILAHLREWPETLEAIEVQRQMRQELLETESALDLDTPPARLKALLVDYSAQLNDSCAGITTVDANRLARGQAGEWLMRCPMSFRDVQ